MKIKDDVLVLEIQICKAGYGGLREVQTFTAREFLQCLAYEKFLGLYEAEAYRLARKD